MRMRLPKQRNSKRVMAVPRPLRGPELKEISTQGSAVTFANTGSVIALTSIAVGDDITERTGRYVRALFIDYNIVVRSATVAQLDTYFWSLLVDKQPNNALHTFANAYNTGTVSGALTLPNTAQWKKRFQELKTHYMFASLTGDNGSHLRGRVMIPAQFSEIEFINQSTGVPGTNGLSLCVSNSSGVNVPEITYNVKVVFTDY